MAPAHRVQILGVAEQLRAEPVALVQEQQHRTRAEPLAVHNRTPRGAVDDDAHALERLNPALALNVDNANSPPAGKVGPPSLPASAAAQSTRPRRQHGRNHLVAAVQLGSVEPLQQRQHRDVDVAVYLRPATRELERAEASAVDDLHLLLMPDDSPALAAARAAPRRTRAARPPPNPAPAALCKQPAAQPLPNDRAALHLQVEQQVRGQARARSSAPSDSPMLLRAGGTKTAPSLAVFAQRTHAAE